MRTASKISEAVKPHVKALVTALHDALKPAIQAHGEYDRFIDQMIQDGSYATHALRPMRFTASHIHSHSALADRFDEWAAEGREYGLLA
jgi:hypothetical protein